mgnify:CR=1 FL=1
MHAAIISPQMRLAPQPAIAPVPTRRKVPGLSRLRNVVRQSRRHGMWILTWSLVGWIGTALAPVLSGQPFLLMMLSPRALFVALASNSVPLLPFVLLGTLRLSVTDASYYLIGRKLPGEVRPAAPEQRGGRVITFFRSIARRGDRICRWFCARPRLAGAFLFFRPNGKYLGLAGAYGVNSWVAGLSATLGTATFLTAVHVGFAAIF